MRVKLDNKMAKIFNITDEKKALKATKLSGRIIRDSHFGSIVKTKDGNFYQLYEVCGDFGANKLVGNPTNWSKIPVKIRDTAFYVSYEEIKKQRNIECPNATYYVADTEIINRLLEFHGLKNRVKHCVFNGTFDTFIDVYKEDGFSEEEYYSLLNGAVDILSSGIIRKNDEGKMAYFAEKGNISAMISGDSFHSEGKVLQVATCKTSFNVIVTK